MIEPTKSIKRYFGVKYKMYKIGWSLFTMKLAVGPCGSSPNFPTQGLISERSKHGGNRLEGKNLLLGLLLIPKVLNHFIQ